MYSHEIKQLLELKNYLLDRKEANKILNIKNSPQINHVKYNTYDDNFEMWTSDNYYFKFKIKRKEMKNGTIYRKNSRFK